jgi:hypothetical protein
MGTGMAVVYEKSDAKMKEELVASLVRTFSVGKRKIQSDVEIPLDGMCVLLAYGYVCRPLLNCWMDVCRQRWLLDVQRAVFRRK